jgi:hypothetical protein
MAVSSFFTTPDTDLFQENSLDPLGILPIWMHYGQSLFNNRLTTVANDVRVFNFNLFHHYILFDFARQYPEVIQTAREKYRDWRTETDMITGLIIFLEQVVAHLFYEEGEKDSAIDTVGILGLNKARLAQMTMPPDQINLRANKSNGLLKNQLILGMIGRYKGPMMNMGYFDRSFTYLPKAWDSYAQVISNWAEGASLLKALHQLFKNELLQSSGRTSPHLSYDAIKTSRHFKQIKDGYLICFGKKRLTPLLRSFWKDQLGLNSGAPGILYDLLLKLPEKQTISHESVFMEAHALLRGETAEQQKIKQILTVEPFLSSVEYLFRYLAQPGIKNIIDIKKDIEPLKEIIIKAANIQVDPAIPRLKSLLESSRWTGDIESWLSNIQSHHRKINEARGGSPWFELDKDGGIKHHYAPLLSESYNTPQKYLSHPFWWHTYYLETLRSVQAGLS